MGVDYFNFFNWTIHRKFLIVLGSSLKSIVIERGGVYLHIKKKDLLFVTKCLSLHSGFLVKEIVDIVGVDYPDHKQRFELIYNCLSLKYNFRCFIKVYLNLFEVIPTVSHLFASCNWLEREVWDMYGIFFEEHNDLRRILTDYGFEGFPLRKDFPLTGFNEVRYNDESSSIVYEPLEIAQEFRYFDFKSPWNFRN